MVMKCLPKVWLDLWPQVGPVNYNLVLAKSVAQTVKCLPAVRETWVLFLGQENPLEKEMAIHSSTLAWKIPWTEEPDRLQSMGSQRVGHDWVTWLHFTLLQTAITTRVFTIYFCRDWVSLVAQLVKNLSTMQEISVQFLGWEDPLEEG